MLPKSAAKFANMRTRLQRLKDAKFFTGWVNEFDENEVRVRLSQVGVCEPGDYFLLEIYGPEVDAVFQARVTMSFENQAYLSVHGCVNYRAATENARLSVTGMLATITTSDMEAEARVIDISRQGVGVLTRRAIPQKSRVKVRLVTPKGEIHAEGEVRYCRADPSGNGSFRAGILLAELGRLEKARWLRLFESEAA